MNLDSKIVLVTGANRGIGHALVDRFLAAGATCVATARSEADAERLAAQLSPFGERALAERVDIADEGQVRGLRNRVRERLRRVDVLVNNAGVLLDEDRRTSAELLPLHLVRRTLETNLLGTIAMCTAFAPLIPEHGRIINLSSTMGQLEDGLEPAYAAYAVSKTALNAYTSSLAAALRRRNILVDAMHPGWVKTAMGGSGARLAPEAATETALFLATREGGETGRFWYEKRIIPW
ncbi:MAG: SDR family NAD(P)-dependent oxidoreductase [Candidatus Baltobacteraceae bacterium]